MTYETASAYLLGTIPESVSPGEPYRLDRMRAFLRELGDPHHAYPIVHVGGTSGKGSTATLIATALNATGKRVGLHTKPHLLSLTERMRIDGAPISEEHFAELLREMMPAVERTMLEHARPSYYETLLALAFLAFARAQVDIAVIEVGLGGRLDGTNVVTPLVSVITNVGLDHTDVLGESLVEIATEKAGIAKPGIPLVTGTEDFAARGVIAKRCTEIDAPLFIVDEHARITRQRMERCGQSLTVETERGRYQISLPLLGRFQQRNVATAIVTLERLSAEFRPSVEALENGLARVELPGRMELFPGHPAVVFDIAHNPDKARNLADALVETFGDRRFTFVVAVGASKDDVGILRPLAALNASFICTSFDTPGRTAVRPQRLAAIAAAMGASARTIFDPMEGLIIARRNADANDVVVVTGSTFLVATLRAWWITNVFDR